MSRTLVHLAIAIATIAAHPMLASAQEPSAKQREAMFRLNEEGFEAFNAGRYEEAATKFAEAFELVPDPNLRKNEAIAWFRAGRCDKAVLAANTFLVGDDTQVSDRREAAMVLSSCKIELAQRALEADNLDLAEQLLLEADALKPESGASERITSLRRELERRRQAKLEAPPQPPQAERDVASSSSALPWVVTAIGVSVITTAVVYHLLSLSAEDEFLDVAAAGRDRARYDTLASQLSTARWLVPTLYAAGLATGGVGVWLFVADTPSSAPAATAGATTVSAGVQWRVTFF